MISQTHHLNSISLYFAVSNPSKIIKKSVRDVVTEVSTGVFYLILFIFFHFLCSLHVVYFSRLFVCGLPFTLGLLRIRRLGNLGRRVHAGTSPSSRALRLRRPWNTRIVWRGKKGCSSDLARARRAKWLAKLHAGLRLRVRPWWPSSRLQVSIRLRRSIMSFSRANGVSMILLVVVHV